MHQIRFQLDLRPRPCWWSLPGPIAGFKGAILLTGRREWKGRRRERMDRRGER